MQWFSTGVGEVGTLPSGEHLAMSGDIFDCHGGEGGGCSWLPGGRGQGCCWTPYSTIDSHTQHGIKWPKTSVVPRLRNLFLKVKNKGSMCVTRKTLAEISESWVLIAVFPSTRCRQITFSLSGLISLFVTWRNWIFTVPFTPKFHDSFFYPMSESYVVFSIICWYKALRTSQKQT